MVRDFPDGSVVKTPCFHCRRHGFNPWSGNQDATWHSQNKIKKKKKKKMMKGKGAHNRFKKFQESVDSETK